jgi:hypothetical protein
MNIETQRTERTSATTPGSMSAATAASTSPASLLPEPSSPGLDGVQDAMSMMYELVSTQGQTAMSIGQVGVDAQNRQEQTQAQQEASALKQEEADEASLETGSLFGSICHIIDNVTGDLVHGRLLDAPEDAVTGVVNTLDSPKLFTQIEQVAPEVAEYVGVAVAIVGAAALTAATCGAGGVVVAAVVIALSASGMFVGATQCAGKDSAYIALGLDITGAVVSMGASSAMIANGALQAATAAADGISGATDVIAGVSSIALGHQQADVVDDTANVQQSMQAMNRNARIVADLVAGLKNAQQSNKNALQVLAGAAQTYDQTLTLASAGKA